MFLARRAVRRVIAPKRKTGKLNELDLKDTSLLIIIFTPQRTIRTTVSSVTRICFGRTKKSLVFVRKKIGNAKRVAVTKIKEALSI